jgi:hypothetical protein
MSQYGRALMEGALVEGALPQTTVRKEGATLLENS